MFKTKKKIATLEAECVILKQNIVELSKQVQELQKQSNPPVFGGRRS